MVHRLVRRFISMTSLVAWVSILSATPSLGLTMKTAQAEDLFPYVKTFAISAYYSPLPGQNHYATGSYDGDIRLNGRGTNGADGTQVYPGMIAAPKTYPFGTKMSIPGVGIVAVHDRGGAIVHAGERGEDYDRLDIWMGAGEDALRRALTWGKKTLDVTVYGIDPLLEEKVVLEGFSMVEGFVKNVVLAPQIFPEDLWYLSRGSDVEKLQFYLKEMGYFAGVPTGYYDDATRKAVVEFQLAEGVIQAPEDFGAGHTGVNTRKMLDLAVARLKEDKDQATLQRFQKGLTLLDKYPDLRKRTDSFRRDLVRGELGEEVRRLQHELSELGFLRIEPTGYFGELTEHAIFKFQQKLGLIKGKDEAGAGIFGPATREQLNAILEERVEQMSYIALNREERALAAAGLAGGSDSGNAGDDDDAGDGPFSRDVAVGDRGADVKELQQLLRKLGFFKGLFITEFYGEQTKAAVQAFQLTNKLIATEQDEAAGVLTPSTRAALNALLM